MNFARIGCREAANGGPVEAVAAPFKDAVRHEGLARTSMRNLAELLIRLWTEPKAKKKPGSENNNLSHS